MIAFRFFAAVSFFILAGSSPKNELSEYQRKIQKNNDNLKSIKNNIDKKISEKNGYLQQEKKICAEIEQAVNKKKKIAETIRRLDSKISLNNKKEKQLKEELQYASLEMEDVKNYLNSDLERYYLEKMVFEDRYEPLNVGASYRLFEVAYKLQMIEDINRFKNEKEFQKKNLADLKLELNSLKAAREAEKAEYAGLESKMKLLQSDLNTKVCGAEEELNNLKKSEAVMRQLISKLESEKTAVQKSILRGELDRKKVESLKGRLAWPLQGKVTSRFGKQKHSSLDTYVINNGIRIESSARQSVHSIARGEVAFSGDFAGYGRVVIIDHNGGFFSIYGNLGEIIVKEKQAVKAFEEIGKLGSISNRENLYFEFRTKGKAVDPLAWLEK